MGRLAKEQKARVPGGDNKKAPAESYRDKEDLKRQFNGIMLLVNAEIILFNASTQEA